MNSYSCPAHCQKGVLCVLLKVAIGCLVSTKAVSLSITTIVIFHKRSKMINISNVFLHNLYPPYVRHLCFNRMNLPHAVNDMRSRHISQHFPKGE